MISEEENKNLFFVENRLADIEGNLSCIYAAFRNEKTERWRIMGGFECVLRKFRDLEESVKKIRRGELDEMKVVDGFGQPIN